MIGSLACKASVPGFLSLRPPRWLSLVALVGVALLHAGCMATGPIEYVRNGFKVGPNYQKPPAPVADSWIEAADAKVQNRYLQDWWVVFNDPKLDSVIHTAYDQNLNLRVLGARVLQARAQRAIAAGELFPQTQQATGQYSRVGLSRNAANNPSNLNPLLGILPAGLIPPNSIPKSWYSDWTGGFTMSWELDFWGRFRRSIESADAKLDSSVENFDSALVTLLADVATNYVQYRVAQERIKIARDNVRIQEGVLALVQAQYRVGINRVTQLDVNQAKTVLEQTRATIPVFQITLGQASDTLCILLGMPPRDLEAELGPGPELNAEPMPLIPTWVAAGIPADLLRRRPDIRSAAQVAAQSAQIGVAEADLYPTIFVNGTLGYDSQDVSQLFESRSFFGTIAPNFKWNILNYGRISNNVLLQRAHTEELIWSYQDQVLSAAQQVQSALRGFLRSQEQAEDLARSVAAAVAASQIGVTQYKAGTVPFNTVFNLETTQVQQQDFLAVAQGNIALNLISVYRALGGGWEIRLTNETSDTPANASTPAPKKEPAATAPELVPMPKALPQDK